MTCNQPLTRRLSLTGGILGAIWMAGSADAQDARTALVVASYAYEGDAALGTARADAQSVSQTLFGLGYSVVRLENPTPSALREALAKTATATDTAVLYITGHLAADDLTGALRMAKADASADPAVAGLDTVPLAELVTTLAPERRQSTLLLLDTCHGPASLAAGGDVMPAPPSAPGLFVAAGAAPGQACPETVSDVASMSGLLKSGLSVPGLDLETVLAAPTPDAPAIWTRSTLPQGFVLRPATSATRLTADDYAMLDRLSPDERAAMIKLWTDAGIPVDITGAPAPAAQTVSAAPRETVVLTAPVQPIRATAVISPVSTKVGGVAPVVDGVTILAAPAAPARSSRPARAVPGAGGLPEPSIIVGEPEIIQANYDTTSPDNPAAETPGIPLTGSLTGSELDFTDVASRKALRDSDPTMFEGLVNGGAFDPPDAQLAAAIQTELSRMGCYTSTIDGQWGRGSRASLQRYYDTIGVAAPSQDPVAEVFRQLMLKDDVTCPVVQQAAAPAPRAATGTARTNTTTTRTAPRAQPAPAPAPAPAPSTGGRRINTNTGVGVFR